MFVHQARLPHVLPPEAYWSPEQYRSELERVFEPAWHVVGSTSDLAHSGDFLTLDLFGRPVIVRNFDGELQAFLNVCTHRHCLLSHEPRGHSDTFRCQYHGWEYAADGRTARIPDAQSFKPLPGGPERLQRFPTERRGPLVFVSLDANAPPLGESLGPLLEVCDEFPAERWKGIDAWEYDFAANWKIPVENTMESYHVTSVHPKTLVRYAAEGDMQHEIHSTAAVMRSPVVAPDLYWRVADLLLPRLDKNWSRRYRIFHGFPNLFLIRIDTMLQVMTVVPTSAETCRMSVRVFVLRAPRETLLTRAITHYWGRFKVWFIRKVLAEDAALYPDLHRGMRASPFRGTLSTREELVFAFQDFIYRRCGLAAEVDSAH